MYKVIVYFTDKQDNDHVYRAGDKFPRSGLKVSAERLKELASASNLRGKPVIEEIKTEKKSGAKNAKEVNTVTTKSTKKGGKKNAD